MTSHADVVRVRNLRVDCVVGVYPHERSERQPLELDVEIGLDTDEAGSSSSIARTIDYHAMSSQLAFLLESARFELLETAAQALVRYLLAPPAPGERRAQIDRARVTLRKPEALAGRGVPEVSIERDRAWATAPRVETNEYGTVDVIYETQKVGVYRLNVDAKKTIPLHRHDVMREAEMVLGDGLLCQGKLVRPGTVFRWPRGALHRYDNPTSVTQTILCVDSPRFVASDEIASEGAPTEITADESRVWVP